MSWLTLQVVSHQIKDNIRNHHESIGLYEVGIWLWIFWPFPFCFLFFLVWCGTREDAKIWFINEAGDCFTPPQGPTKLSLLFFYIFLFWQFYTLFRYCLVQRTPLFFFSIFLSSIFDWLIFLFFLKCAFHTKYSSLAKELFCRPYQIIFILSVFVYCFFLIIHLFPYTFLYLRL